jgi:hypothetical protein
MRIRNLLRIRIHIIKGSWVRNQIRISVKSRSRIRIKAKSMIRIRIKVQIRELSSVEASKKRKPGRAVDAQNGNGEAQNSAV